MKSRKATSGSDGRVKTSVTKPKPISVTPADYRMLIETFPQWVWIADAKGHVTFCNRYWYEFSGFTVEQTFRNEWQTVLHPDDKELAARIWENAVANGKAYESEFRCK